jgi:hypothetical protein
MILQADPSVGQGLNAAAGGGVCIAGGISMAGGVCPALPPAPAGGVWLAVSPLLPPPVVAGAMGSGLSPWASSAELAVVGAVVLWLSSGAGVIAGIAVVGLDALGLGAGWALAVSCVAAGFESPPQALSAAAKARMVLAAKCLVGMLLAQNQPLLHS